MSKTTVALVTTAQALGPRHEALARNAEANGLIELVVMDEEQGVAAIVDHCRDAEVLICRNIDMINEVAVGLRNLKLIQTFSAGTDRLDKHILASRGVHVANNGGANAVSVAESAIWLMLTINHKFQEHIASVRAGQWQGGVTGPLSEFTTMHDRQVGIVGLGRIGSRVAKRLQAWECNVVYHDVVDLADDYVAATGAKEVALDELIETSDMVSLHVPLDRATHHLFGVEQFKAMKSTAVLINTCRGPVVDEGALVAALQAGEIWGAGLDVTEQEPMSMGSELLNLPNVVITPHLATKAIQSEWNADANVVANAERIARGEAPEWVVAPV